jgi:hypothetical protein
LPKATASPIGRAKKVGTWLISAGGIDLENEARQTAHAEFVCEVHAAVSKLEFQVSDRAANTDQA